MKSKELLEQYLAEVEKLSQESHAELLSFIEKQIAHYAAKGSISPHFLKGEKLFHSGEYKEALKHYLLSTDVPCYQFFCYRASAFALHKANKSEKAAALAKEALKLHPKDFFTLQLFPKSESETLGRVALGAKELDELYETFGEK